MKIASLDTRIINIASAHLAGFIILASLSMMLLNYFIFHYQGINYLPYKMTFQILLIILLLKAGLMLLFDKKHWLISIADRSLLSFSLLCLLALYTTAIQLTPFAPIDSWLLAIDKFMHINQPHILKFSHNHSWFFNSLNAAYNLLHIELSCVFMAIILLPESNKQSQFIFLLLISAAIGFLIYYFLPTTAPASIINSSLFLDEQRETYLKFHQIHHHLPITVEGGGLIALPSFHCIWAVLCQYYFMRWPRLGLLLAPLNIWIITACLMLGWHYLIDILASILLLILSVIILNSISKPYTTEIREI